MPILSTGVRVKDAVSSLVPAPLPSMTSSALVLPEVVSIPVEVVVHAPLILDLTTVSGSTLVTVMIATTLVLLLMLDFLPFKASEDLLVPSASLVLLTLRALALLPLSASSILAVDLVAVLSSPLVLVASLLSAPRRVMSAFLAMLVLLTAPIPSNIAPLLVRSLALVVVWVEVLATTVLVSARLVRARIVLLLK